MAVRHALGRIRYVWRYHVLSPIVRFCVPSSLVLRHSVFLLFLRAMMGFSVDVVSLWWPLC